MIRFTSKIFKLIILIEYWPCILLSVLHDNHIDTWRHARNIHIFNSHNLSAWLNVEIVMSIDQMPTGESKRVWSTFFIKFWRIKTINHKQKKEAKKHYRKVVRKRDKVLVTILKDNLGILWSMNLSEWTGEKRTFEQGMDTKIHVNTRGT